MYGQKNAMSTENIKNLRITVEAIARVEVIVKAGIIL
jgi:hypothetical protein